ncbi:MAG: S8 family serine peptidase [Bacteroidota bacterium]
MKKLLQIACLVCGLSTSLFAQTNIDYSKLASGLIERIEQTEEDFLPIFIEMDQQLSLEDFRQRFATARIPAKERAKEVVNLLKQQQEASQPQVRAFIDSRPEEFIEESLNAFWVSNTICLEARPELIAALSLRDDIVHIGYQGIFEAEEYEVVEWNAPPAPNGTELGLRVVNAPAMWRMGYTGRGQKALVIDSGVEPTTPAISTQYIGNSQTDDVAWLNNEVEASDCGEHGTHVAGTLLGLDRMRNDTIGMAFNAGLLGSAIYSGCGGGFGYVIRSFEWALDPDGNPNTTDDMPDVVNNSWRWGENNQCNGTFRATFDALEAAGIAIVFSAGNSGPDVSTITSPKNINSSLVNVFCVGNLNASDNLAINNSSSRGPSICGLDSSLYIKPEVSAPGTQVRSALPDGSYASWNGTSMAAPHAAGAILLLKEAFPDLTGEELKLALYFSARDLGEPGEDNDYGMGIIDVKAAYDYLVAQGNTPVPPEIPSMDILMAGMELPDVLCRNENPSGRALLENNGSETITSAKIELYVDDMRNPVRVMDMTESLAPGQRRWIDLPIDLLGAGRHTIMVRAVQPNGGEDELLTNNGQRRRINILAGETLSIDMVGDLDNQPCRGNAALLFSDYEGEGRIEWYDRLGVNLLAEGPYFQTPIINSPTTYRLEVVETPDIGPIAPEGNIRSTNEGGLSITLSQEARLTTVKVYSDTRGSRSVKLLSTAGDQLQSRTVLLRSAGENEIDLNFVIPAGTYYLVLDSSRDLDYHRTNIDFPYTEGAVTINGSLGRNNVPLTSEYRFFYDLQFEYEYLCGASSIDIEPLLSQTPVEAAFTIESDTIQFFTGEPLEVVDASTNAVSWFWDFGDGNTSTEQTPTHQYSEEGVYLISLTVENEDGCTDVFTRQQEVLRLVTSNEFVAELEQQINVFPNPVESMLTISIEFAQQRQLRMIMTDVLGRPVWEDQQRPMSQERLSISTQSLSEGVYYLNFYVDGRYALSRRLVKIK